MAAEYKVSACGTAAGFQNHLLGPSASDSRLSAYTACPNDGSGHAVGVAALAEPNRGTVPFFASAMQTFTAPAGTTIRRVHLRADGRAWNGDWTSLLQASTDRFASNTWNLSGCTATPGSVNGCVSAHGANDLNYEIPGATGVRSVIGCAHFGGCTTFSTDGWPYSRSYYFIHEFDVTLDDVSNPSVSATGGGLASGQWLHGTHSLSFNAGDNSGIRRTRFWVDDLGVIRNDVRGCDYTYAVPCSNVSGGEYSLDTAQLSDGVHHVAADGVDATDSNWSNTYHAIFVDNHAPAEPRDISVGGGQGWHTANSFNIQWTNPESAAPITRAYYEVCRADGSNCGSASRAEEGVSRLSGVQVPQPGDYTIRVWLEDAAGNVSGAKSAPLHLKFDNVAPAQAAPQHRNGWVDREEAKVFDQKIEPPKDGAVPVSGIAGYAVTSNSSEPGNTVDTVASASPNYIGRKELVNLPEGVTMVKARAVSGAGVASSQVGSTEIYVDRTAPGLELGGAPDPDRWKTSPVALTITARDPSQLSGMASGPGDRGFASGGYIEFIRDGQQAEQFRGPERPLLPDGRLEHAPAATAVVNFGDDGAHQLTYHAFDVAGNATADKSVRFKIDATPPEFVVFEQQDPADPRLVTVAASDRTSGLADGGRIQLQRVAPTEGDWITLRTTREGDRYYARLNNATLAAGDYRFRAAVPDQAGNEAIGTADRQGREVVVHISPTEVGPASTTDSEATMPPQDDSQDGGAGVDTKITAGAVKKTKAKKKCKPRKKAGRHGWRKKRCIRVPAEEMVVHDLRVPFGRSAQMRGRLTTDNGQPIAGAEITVLARLATAGAEYAAEGSIRTGPAGTFAYTAPAGAARTIDFHYRGDETYRHADDQVSLRVPASATLKANRRALRNGGSVLFSGKLLGKPYPPKGKLIDLQAFYRNKWRTFAAPRGTKHGRWKYRYRFEATRGIVVYRFRVRVRATSDYPYELGYSRAIRIRVTGHR